jgi:hypothetical protein
VRAGLLAIELVLEKGRRLGRRVSSDEGGGTRKTSVASRVGNAWKVLAARNRSTRCSKHGDLCRGAEGTRVLEVLAKDAPNNTRASCQEARKSLSRLRGADRNRTDDGGFADLCLTTWLRRRTLWANNLGRTTANLKAERGRFCRH